MCDKAKGLLSKYLIEEFQELSDNGFMVVKNAVPKNDIDILKQSLSYDIKMLKNIYNIKDPQKTVLFQQYGIGQLESTWKCRIATISVWQQLFQTKQLISSWDAVTYIEKNTQYNLQKKLNEYGEPDWLHRDQNCNNSNLADNIQGFLALSDTNDCSHSTIFYKPKSFYKCAQDMIDAFHQQFYSKTSRAGRKIHACYDDTDFHIFSEDELLWLRDHCDLVKPNLDSGDMLLWCSALPHASGPSKHIKATTDIDTRLGIFVAMMPKQLATNFTLVNRRQLAKKIQTSSHNVLNPQLFPFSFKNEKLKHEIQYSDSVKKMKKELIG